MLHYNFLVKGIRREIDNNFMSTDFFNAGQIIKHISFWQDTHLDNRLQLRSVSEDEKPTFENRIQINKLISEEIGEFLSIIRYKTLMVLQGNSSTEIHKFLVKYDIIDKDSISYSYHESPINIEDIPGLELLPNIDDITSDNSSDNTIEYSMNTDDIELNSTAPSINYTDTNFFKAVDFFENDIPEAIVVDNPVQEETLFSSENENVFLDDDIDLADEDYSKVDHESLIAIDEKVDAFRVAYTDALMSGDLSKAKSILEDIVLLENDNVAGCYHLGMILFAQDDISSAEYFLQKVVRLDPSHDKALATLAMIDFKYQNNHSSALDKLALIENMDIHEANNYLLKSKIYKKLRDFNKCREAFLMASDLDSLLFNPKNVKRYLNLE